MNYSTGVSKNILVRLLGTRFTNAISYFEPCPQDIFKCPVKEDKKIWDKVLMVKRTKFKSPSKITGTPSTTFCETHFRS
jgi:hypothetical protein